MPWRVEEDGVLRRMARRLENLGLGLGGQDILRSGVQVDEVFNVWSSDPVLVWLVVNRACCDWAVSTMLQRARLSRARLTKFSYSADARRISSESYLLRMRYGCGSWRGCTSYLRGMHSIILRPR